MNTKVRMNTKTQKADMNAKVKENPKLGKPPERDTTPSGTLARGLAVLKVVIDSPQPLTLAEIAAQSGIDQSTTLRLLRALEDSEYIVRSFSLKRYLPSPRAIRPLPLSHPIEQFRRETARTLSELADNLGQTVILALFIGSERMIVDVAQRSGSLSPYYDTWLKSPVHATAVGKVLLLSADPAMRQAILGPEPFEQHTAHTITKLSQLESDLNLSKERGYIVARDEYQIGLTAIGAPISTWNDYTVGCLAVTGHTRSFDGEKLDEAGLAVKRAAQFVPYQANSLHMLEQIAGCKLSQGDHSKK
jgi:IclR family acetate operon transcriptional repressor